MLRAALTGLTCLVAASSATLHEEIYYTFDDTNTDGVALLLNVDSQIGATSNTMAGDVGALYRINNDDDAANFQASANGKAYVALISQPMVAKSSVMNGLLDQDKLKGFLIYDYDTPAPFSAANNDDGWNPLGGGYGESKTRGLHWHNLGRPAFLLRGDDNTTVHEKYNETDSVNEPNGRTLGIRLSFFMWASGNAKSCLRRAGINGGYFCQPLGGQNVGGTLKPYNNQTDNTTILVSAQMDSLALFHEDSTGAAAQAASLAAFIALARMVAVNVTVEQRAAASHNVLFMGLQGEQFDFIGSSVFLEGLKHEMEGYHFPAKQNQIQISDIKMHIELGQMMSSDSAAYYVQNNGTSDVLTGLTALGLTAPTNANAGLPPTSSAGKLREWNSTWTQASVVITDFDESIGTDSSGNQHLYTRHDDAANLGFINTTASDSDRIVNMCAMVRSVASYIRSTATLAAMDDEAAALADCQLVSAQLLQMLLFDGSVQVNMTDYSLSVANAANKPVNRYVSVGDVATVKPTEAIIFWHLSAALANSSHNNSECDVSLIECSDSHFDSKQEKSSYCKVQPSGTGINATMPGTADVAPCWTTTTFFQNAMSPAFLANGFTFDIDDELAKSYSTWTESTWQVGKVEVFLLQDESEGNTVLGIGLAYMFCMILSVWQVNKRCGAVAEN